MKIEIKGKEYGLHWGLGAIECAADIYGVSEDEIFNSSINRVVNTNILDDGSIEMKIGKELGIDKRIVFGAVFNWAIENDVKVEFTEKNFTNVFNDLPLSFQDDLLKAYKKSIFKGRVVEEIFDEILAKLPRIEEEVDNKTKKKTRTTSKSSKTASSGG